MKILELTNFSSGGCGVWKRVSSEAQILAEKNKVEVFSSNKTKGSNQIAQEEEQEGKVHIRRFNSTKLGGESFMRWNYTKEAIAYKPEVIIAHSYRHYHTLLVPKIAKKINARTYLVTHAPFGRKRSLIQTIATKLFDSFIGPKLLKKYDKIITITKWEIPYLEKLGVTKEKIVLIPNGINESYLSTPINTKEENKILYFGRISPIKKLETLIEAFSKLKNSELKLELYGPAEEEYLITLKKLINELQLEKTIIITNKTYNTEEGIKTIDKAKIVVLPSESEGMPQTLIEAMARKKIVIASNNEGNCELITSKKNGYLFTIGNSEELANCISEGINAPNIIREEARKKAEQYSWKNIIGKLEKTIHS